MGPTIAIHANPALQHQQQFGEYFLTGFKRHGIKAELTSNVNQEADVHVVLGPHYARDRWAGNHTILLDRGWWGDPAWDVSIGWMNHNTGMIISTGNDDTRPKPELLAMREGATPFRPGSRCIGLLDYGMPPEKLSQQYTVGYALHPQWRADAIRPHPADKTQGDLIDALAGFHRAIGYRTSALVTALIQGLRVYCLDVRNPAHHDNCPSRETWLNNLSHHHYNGDEIASGLVWEFLCNCRSSPVRSMSLSNTAGHATI